MNLRYAQEILGKYLTDQGSPANFEHLRRPWPENRFSGSSVLDLSLDLQGLGWRTAALLEAG
jgi:hypothetical protein